MVKPRRLKSALRSARKFIDVEYTIIDAKN